jgi:hypothetical protein
MTRQNGAYRKAKDAIAAANADFDDAHPDRKAVSAALAAIDAILEDAEKNGTGLRADNDARAIDDANAAR